MILLGAAVIYFMAPIVWLFIASTKNAGDLYSTPAFSFADWNLWKNIADVSTFRDGIFWRWMLNSGVYSVLGSIATTLVSAMCGYALAVYEFRGRSVVIGAIVGSLMVSGTVLAQPLYLLLVQLHLNDSVAGILLPGLVYPFGVMICYTAARASVPREIIEAARIDGANEYQIFFRISLPLIQTGLATVLLFAFLGSWNSYLMPLLVLNNNDLYPVTVGLASWSQQTNSDPHLATLTLVGSAMSIAPLIATFMLLQRYWRGGVASGAVKF